jgi:hypothetical protein
MHVYLHVCIYIVVITLLSGCGGDFATRNASTLENANTGGADTSLTTNENNTTIPKSGIYNASDDAQTKYLKVINYARGIARECKKNDGAVQETSRGFFPAADPLTTNQDLYAAALEHSKDMAESNTFSHLGSGTVSDVTGSNLGHPSRFVERIEANGYVSFSRIGENIAAGQATIEDAVHAWLESPGHCANIMNADYTEMGLAKYENPNSHYKIYWTNEFGAR